MMVRSGQGILQELGVNGCDVAEVEQVIGSNFANWGGDRNDPQALLFPGDQEAYAIKLIYDSKHRIVDALAGPELDDAKLTEIKHHITTALLTRESKISTWVLFAPIPVTGAFRYREEFQILPVPNEAPRPSYLLADHPFLLQFQYGGSTNVWVDQRRRMANGRELELLLAGLLNSHIHSNRDQTARWVIPPETETPPPTGVRHAGQVPTSVLCQSSYIYPGMTGISKDFTLISGYEPLRTISPSEFLGRQGVRAGQVFDLPANFEQMISAYKSLKASQKLKLGNACFWLQHAARTYRDSRSAAYIALAFAIESLMPPPESGKTCGCCHRNIGKGPTQHFKEFVNQFAPAAGPWEAKTKCLYETRSKLAHGHGLLISDREQLLAPALASLEEWQNEDYLSRIVRIALVNWLDKHAPSNGKSGAV